MHRLWPEAADTIDEILDFWFPFGDLAAIFREGLARGGGAHTIGRDCGSWPAQPAALDDTVSE
jgi:hypothetical protein